MAMEKVSLSLPADLLVEARKYAKNGNLSAYGADGLRTNVLADRQRQLLAELDKEFGPLTDEDMEEARHIWNDRRIQNETEPGQGHARKGLALVACRPVG